MSDATTPQRPTPTRHRIGTRRRWLRTSSCARRTGGTSARFDAQPHADADLAATARGKLFVLDMFRTPSGSSSRGPPARLRHDVFAPVQAHDGPRRPAHHGLRRVGLPADRGETGQHPATAADVTTYRRQLRGLGLAHDHAAACRRPIPSSTAGRSGSSAQGVQRLVRPRPGRARPIAEFIGEFKSAHARVGRTERRRTRDIVDGHRLGLRERRTGQLVPAWARSSPTRRSPPNETQATTAQLPVFKREHAR